jgi:hypothetical protein
MSRGGRYLKINALQPPTTIRTNLGTVFMYKMVPSYKATPKRQKKVDTKQGLPLLRATKWSKCNVVGHGVMASLRRGLRPLPGLFFQSD